MLSSFVLDKPSIMERLGDDEEIFSMMVAMFLDDVDNNCAALQAAVQATDAVQLQREAHTIKGLLATFSDDAGADLAFALEKQARAGEVAAGAAQVPALIARVQDVAGVLRRLSGR
ncbi:Hpt domain-containing protein [Azonexus sp.]|uniref:Hpt domain-containing protein n=1 Tax=Azonexus sp. TaxID=1872668 RepID=UPI0027BA24B5|nr:Hpt domain-containing protein [Azonexus sp.]